MTRVGASAGRRQRGALALVLALILFVAMAMTLAFANRNVWLEQRSSAQHHRHARALAAAEAGIDWSIAQLNANRRIGDDCLSTADTAAGSYRTRLLGTDPTSGVVTPTGTGVAAACTLDDAGWRCRCASASVAAALASLVAAVPTTTAAAGPMFSVAFSAGGRPGTVHLAATGCSRAGTPCASAAPAKAEASAAVEIALALRPVLPTPPAAAITAGGAVDLGDAPATVVNTDPGTGLLVHAGGAVTATSARLRTAAGGATGSATLDHDAPLAALSADRYFAAYFGSDPATWAGGPAVVSIACPADCGDALASELGAAADGAVVHVDGDVVLAGPRTLGTAEHPLLLVARGAIVLQGDVVLHGVFASRSFSWNGAGASAALHGALIAHRDVRIRGTPTVERDADVLGRLQRTLGGWTRIAGSWRER